jgi:hypothetical protein
LLIGGKRLRIEKCGIELWNRPRPTQGCRVIRRRRRIQKTLQNIAAINNAGVVQESTNEEAEFI